MFDYRHYMRAPDLLPWLAYDEDTSLFLLDGNYLGFAFTAMPLSGYDGTMQRRFASLLNAEFPKGTYLMFNLMVFDDVSEHLFNFKQARAGGSMSDPLLQTATSNTIEFIKNGAAGRGAPVSFRNSTLMISMKLGIEDMIPNEDEVLQASRLRRDLLQSLTAIGFSDIRPVNDTELLYNLSIILNRDPLAAWRYGRAPVDESRFIREQVLDYDTSIGIGEKVVRIGSSYVTSLSAKRLPQQSYFGKAERYSVDPLSGDRGIPCAHMITATIKYEDITEMRPKIETRRTYNGKYANGPFGNLLPEYGRRYADLNQVSELMTAGEQLHRFSLNIMLFSDDEEAAYRNATGVRTYLNELGFSIMEDAGIAFHAIRSNLPMGIEKEDEKNLSRLKMMNTSAMVTLIPAFYEWRGTQTPLISLVGRGGQVMGFSPFDSGTNYNLTISAESGAGKSFFTNELISALLGTGGKVWVIDVGRSYMKLCETLKGQFLCFDRDSTICLNPFTTIQTDADFEEVQDILMSMLGAMARPQGGLDDFQSALLQTILIEQFKIHRQDLSIDNIAEACFAKAKELAEGSEGEFEEKRISDVGFGLQAFTTNGPYGKYFNGPANIDFSNKFVLLELEELKSQKHLQKIVLLMLIFQIQNGMYLGDRDVKKLMVIDEAWDLLSDPQIAKFIEAGYRRFRKYNGSACIITQALTDLYDSDSGRAIIDNSAYTVMLQQKGPTLDRLSSGEEKVFERALTERLKTVRSIKGLYSEVFVKSAAGQGIGRFVVDPFRAILYSTRGEDVAEVDKRVKAGATVEQAINAMIEARSRLGL
ncbi:type IV secretion system protein TraC [Sinirhodobacter populi]|uniref:Type IV secretion system protein TraC n=1 Tax=Paenirhodobacter populi TaxID=2306993 RepID=A0A443KCN0_9RHOB|nr:type IV secretion system protein TraC [Sinirhodobacter populi]RWR30548.1 type IV secretion system protein TraC [Sinirhodobacter populi]